MIEKDNLKLKQRYSWNNGGGMHSNRPFFGDHLAFNRHDGYQVLHLINKLSTQLSGVLLSGKIEEMLIFLPEKNLTHIQAREWVIRNWHNAMKMNS